jgi:hypothetical protein
MNPRLKYVGLSFQLSSPQKRDGLSLERRRSDVRLHDTSPAGTTGSEFAEQLNALTAKILPGGGFVHRNLAESSVFKVHSRFSREVGSAFTRRKFYLRVKELFSMANLSCMLRFLPRLKLWVSSER